MKETVAKRLIAWYRKHGRRFSFRQTRDPYRVLVAEMMLRKTTARQVEKVFGPFFERFPTVESLAAANPEAVREVIRPLGIRSRAMNLIQTARKIVEEHSGKIPADFSELTRLPGVGEYVAGCVLTFCYGRPHPLIDSNATRVLSRLCGIADPSQLDARRKLREVYSRLVPRGREREFHYALLDLAAALCRPQAPSCALCPLTAVCHFAHLRSKVIKPSENEDY
jgi:A/G-specific adenine glycosylase